MISAIFQYKNLVINYLPGEVFSREDLPSKSIALDGMVKGSFIDTLQEKISFDHHSASLPRHAQQPTCKQVWDAKVLNWNFPTRGNNIWVYINDVDLDSMLSVFILSIARKDIKTRLETWVHVAGDADIFGPAYEVTQKTSFIRDFLYYKILRDYGSDRSSVSVITTILDNFDRYLRQENLSYNKHLLRPKEMFIIDKSLFKYKESQEIPINFLALQSEDPVFKYAYREGADLVLGIRRKSGNFKYSIAKRHDYVPYDLDELLNRISEVERGWGGASSIIGSPQGGSTLTPKILIQLIKGVKDGRDKAVAYNYVIDGNQDQFIA